jgi:hypothetical protein
MLMGYEAFLSSMVGRIKMGNNGVYGRTSHSFDNSSYNRSISDTSCFFPVLVSVDLVACPEERTDMNLETSSRQSGRITCRSKQGHLAGQVSWHSYL